MQFVGFREGIYEGRTVEPIIFPHPNLLRIHLCIIENPTTPQRSYSKRNNPNCSVARTLRVCNFFVGKCGRVEQDSNGIGIANVIQWLFLVSVKGGRDYITSQKAIYKWYTANWVIIYYLPPFTGTYRNLKNPWLVIRRPVVKLWRA